MFKKYRLSLSRGFKLPKRLYYTYNYYVLHFKRKPIYNRRVVPRMHLCFNIKMHWMNTGIKC